MQIRRAEAADEKALANVRRCAILALAVPVMSTEQAERWATRGAADRVAQAIRNHDVWVAVEEAVIGWVEVDRDRVAALYVSPSCSRRGIGSALLSFAETSMQSSGYTTAHLESSPNALDYYLRRGYLRCGPADAVGALPMRKDLTAVTPDRGMEYQRAAPVLQVANVEVSARWYADVLGFTPSTFPANPPYSFAILRRDGAEIMLQCTEETPPCARKPPAESFWSVYLRVAATAVLDVAAAVGRTTTIPRGPERMFYGLVEFEIYDPDGYRICISGDAPAGGRLAGTLADHGVASAPPTDGFRPHGDTSLRRIA